MRVISTPRLLSHEPFPFEGRRPLIDLGKLKRVEFEGDFPFWLVAPGVSFDTFYHAALALFEAKGLIVERVVIAGVSEREVEHVPEFFGFVPVEFSRVFRSWKRPSGLHSEIREKQGKLLLYRSTEDGQESLLVFASRFMEARVCMEGVVSELLHPLRFDSIPIYS